MLIVLYTILGFVSYSIVGGFINSLAMHNDVFCSICKREGKVLTSCSKYRNILFKYFWFIGVADVLIKKLFDTCSAIGSFPVKKLEEKQSSKKLPEAKVRK